MSKRYIDAGLLLAQCRRNPLFEKTEKDKGMVYIERSIIDNTPTADVVEVRHGEWEYEQLDEYKYYKVTCPYCNAEYYGNYDAYHDPDDFNYCPNCGAKMDGERRANDGT